jgi:FAD/FMN-containing dehydrogenase
MAVDALRARIAGAVIGPDDERYDRHRVVFNAMVDRRPAVIARCRSRDDVISALAFRAEHDLPVAVRCGATSDYATVDGGIIIDLSPLKVIEVDPEAGIARVGGGLTWAEMDAATQAHGLAVTGARVSGLGVAGVTLGGGTGWLERTLGPSCQSLIGAEVVLADGRVVDASEQENPGLLWALRGGGGNFGVVTELRFRLHPVGPTLLSGFLGFRRERAAEVARFYRDYMAEAPDEVGGALVLFAGRGGALNVAFCYAGEVGDGERAIAPLRELGPSLDAVAPNEYRAFQAMTDLHHPFGMRCRLGGAFLRELTDEALEVAITHANKVAPALSQVLLQPLGAAMTRMDRDAMALNVPDAPWTYQCVGLWPPVESLDHTGIAWTEGFSDAMRPWDLGVKYPSLIAPEEPGSRLIASYGPEGYARLQRVKARYDPDNVFRANPNIESPADPSP